MDAERRPVQPAAEQRLLLAGMLHYRCYTTDIMYTLTMTCTDSMSWICVLLESDKVQSTVHRAQGINQPLWSAAGKPHTGIALMCMLP